MARPLASRRPCCADPPSHGIDLPWQSGYNGLPRGAPGMSGVPVFRAMLAGTELKSVNVAFPHSSASTWLGVAAGVAAADSAVAVAADDCDRRAAGGRDRSQRATLYRRHCSGGYGAAAGAPANQRDQHLLPDQPDGAGRQRSGRNLAGCRRCGQGSGAARLPGCIAGLGQPHGDVGGIRADAAGREWRGCGQHAYPRGLLRRLAGNGTADRRPVAGGTDRSRNRPGDRAAAAGGDHAGPAGRGYRRSGSARVGNQRADPGADHGADRCTGRD